MRSLRIHTYEDPNSGTEEKLVQFAAPSVDLGHVVANSGQIFGAKGQNLKIEGSRVIINGGINGTRLVLQDSKCRFDNLDQFQVVNGLGKILFSAQHPFVTIDNKIKQIAANYIITNKIRSPIDEDLIIKAENANLRGNGGVQMEAKKFNLTAATSINLKTSTDGTIRINGKRLFLGNRFRLLEVSTSPALTASLEAFRVCICNGVRPKLFIVDGNKNCSAATTVCK
uniref:Beta-sarcoglycan n=1 Tax=Acrobeloides nanus TaxID=290746 RepID=A0A914CA38_9BILA